LNCTPALNGLSGKLQKRNGGLSFAIATMPIEKSI
jgi:hypothetical protein